MALPSFAPQLRADLLRRDLDHEAVIWSPLRSTPTALDAIATVMLSVIDGTGTVDELAEDVRDVVGLDGELARAQVNRIVDQLDAAGALATSSASTPERQRELFVNPPSS